MIEGDNGRLGLRPYEIIRTDGRRHIGIRIDQHERVAAPLDRRRYLIHHHSDAARLFGPRAGDLLKRDPSSDPGIYSALRDTCSIDSRSIMVMTVADDERSALVRVARPNGCSYAGSRWRGGGWVVFQSTAAGGEPGPNTGISPPPRWCSVWDPVQLLVLPALQSLSLSFAIA